MNKKRLLKLAHLLEADAKNKKGIRFDLSGWGRADGDTIELNCGTKACAVGLAIVSDAFRRAGLSNSEEGSTKLCPMMKSGARGYDAVTELFQIDDEAANFLFQDDSYPPLKQRGAIGERYVAKRIRDFVAGKVSPNS